MFDVDYTTTAVYRPEIFARTLESFRQNLLGFREAAEFGTRQTLHINIDPYPACGDKSGKLIESMFAAASRHFRNVHFHAPKEPSFPAAVRWCWRQPTTEFFFHLEDDWELLHQVRLDAMVGLLRDDQALSCVNLRAYDFPPEDSRICLSPGLHRTAHAREMAYRLSLSANPEKQLRPVAAGNPQGDKHLGYKGRQYPPHVVLRDLGRPWLAASGWRKETPIHFTRWVTG